MTAQPAGVGSPPGAGSPLAVDRARTVIRVWGRDPVKMLQGLATADIEALTPGRAVYTVFLTPKGRLVADARILLRPGDHETPELLLVTHPGATEGLLAHLRKFIPPLFARFEDVSEAWRVIGVHGPGASGAAGAALEDASGLSADAPEESLVAASTDPPLLAIRTLEAGGDGWDLLVDAGRAAAVGAALEGAGVRRGTEDELERLRIMAGRPRWGAELTEDVIPIEAGLLERAISQTKGCYTGQEVIVRILHRGHVNRHLRSLSFRGTPPEPGTELFEAGSDKPRGVITSVAAEAGAGRPAGGQGLGYVRREVEPPAELRAGSPGGPPVRVAELP